MKPNAFSTNTSEGNFEKGIDTIVAENFNSFMCSECIFLMLGSRISGKVLGVTHVKVKNFCHFASKVWNFIYVILKFLAKKGLLGSKIGLCANFVKEIEESVCLFVCLFIAA
jgi:hypothetical protein